MGATVTRGHRVSLVGSFYFGEYELIMSVCDPTVNSTEGSEGLPLVELDAFGMPFLWPFIGFQGPNQPAALHFAAWGHE